MTADTGAAAIAAYVGQPGKLAAEWDTIPLDRRQAILRSVLDHIEIHPIGKGKTFDPRRVSRSGSTDTLQLAFGASGVCVNIRPGVARPPPFSPSPGLSCVCSSTRSRTARRSAISSGSMLHPHEVLQLGP